jgi:hypothetical protein
MAIILSPAMSDQDLLGAITHYEPRIQNCLISANLKSTQETLSSLNYNLWKIRESNIDKHGEILNAKTKIAEHRDTSLLAAWGIADLLAVFRYAMSGVMAGTGTLGAI